MSKHVIEPVSLSSHHQISRYLCLLTFAIVYGLVGQATALADTGHKPIRVITNAMSVDSSHTPSQTPFHRELWNILSEGLPEHTLDVVPVIRLNTAHDMDTQSCAYPALKDMRPQAQHDKLQSGIVTKINVRAFTRPGEPVIHRKQDLKHKQLVIPLGKRLLLDIVDVPYKTIVVTSFGNRIRMLLKHRVDVMIGASPNADLLFMEQGIDEKLYDTDFLLAEIPFVLQCHKGESQQAFINAFNKNLKVAYMNGHLEAFYRNHKLHYEEFMVDPDSNRPFANFPLPITVQREIERH